MKVFIGGVQVEVMGETKQSFSISDDNGKLSPASGVFLAPFTKVNDRAFKMFRTLSSVERFNRELVPAEIEEWHA
jgi:hypothetical protein